MRLDLKSKIILITVIVIIIFIGINAVFSWISFSAEYISAVESRAFTIGKFLNYQLDRLLGLNIPLNNIIGFDSQCRDIINKFNDISYAMVTDLNGLILFHNDPLYIGKYIKDNGLIEKINLQYSEKEFYSYTDGEFHNISIPVKSMADNTIGYIRIGYLKVLIPEKVNSVIFNTVFISLIILVIFIFILIGAISIWVTKPLSRLINIINNIRKKGTQNIEFINIESKDELGDLSKAFNLMITELKQYHKKINHYTEKLEEQVKTRTSKLDALNKQLQNDLKVMRMAKEEERRLQEELQRAQKMEAVGTLAAGVAHDLNNILSSIVSYPDLLLLKCSPDDPIRRSLEIIKTSGQKAAAIVNDLLTLARRNVSVKTALNLNYIIKDYLKSPEYKNLLHHHNKVEVEVDLAKNLYPVLASSIHLSKTIMNLVTNSAEAMPDGGKIRLKTENRYVENIIMGYDKIGRGNYVVLTISDTGIGISKKNIKRIFEPFYTRKEMGKSGTGLGMAVVWSTIKDLHGYIDVKSKKGKGTTFTLYFPISNKKIKKPEKVKAKDVFGKGEVILVVDDLKLQRDITCEILSKLNYNIFTVSSGEEAVDFVKKQPVDLIVLDMIMEPGINGLETYKQILKVNHNQKAIIVSGYSETESVREALTLGAGAFIRKPYTLEEIGAAVREELKKIF